MMWARTTIGLALLCMTAGCGDGGAGDHPPPPATLAERTSRAAFSGAPPVIPHERQSGKCVTCHSATGGRFPAVGTGWAPANPHLSTPGMSAESRCTQCHVFATTANVFVENDFVGLLRPVHGERAFPGAPPVIPHRAFMREDCLACHSGNAARREIQCSHTERTNCRQCHVYQSPANRSEAASLAHR